MGLATADVVISGLTIYEFFVSDLFDVGNYFIDSVLNPLIIGLLY